MTCADAATTRTDGMTYDEFRKSVREEITSENAQSDPEPGGRQRRRSTTRSLLSTQVGTGASRHTIALPENPTPDQIKTAQTKAEGIGAGRSVMEFGCCNPLPDSQNALEAATPAGAASLRCHRIHRVIKTMNRAGDPADSWGQRLPVAQAVETRMQVRAAQQVTEYHAQN